MTDRQIVELERAEKNYKSFSFYDGYSEDWRKLRTHDNIIFHGLTLKSNQKWIKSCKKMKVNLDLSAFRLMFQ